MKARDGDKQSLTQQGLRELVDYDPGTGVFTWKKNSAKRKAGTRAGWVHSKGYICLDINQRKYYAHRLVWLYMTGRWPGDQIDHIDFNKSNNVWLNLREATNAQNQQYQSVSRASSTGLKGAYPGFAKYQGVVRKTGTYYSQITVGGHRIHLGHFKTPEEAHAAYMRAAERYYGAFARA